MKEVTLNTQDYHAIALTVIAVFLWVLVYGWSVLLAYCENKTNARERIKLIRIASAKVLIQYILITHTANSAVFMFMKSGWQQLANWINFLLPEKGSSLIMVLSYFAFFAVLKITRQDVVQLISDFFRKGPNKGQTSAQ